EFERIRRTRVADRHRHHGHLGGFWMEYDRYHPAPQGETYVRCDLVLHRHLRNGSCPAYCQLVCHSGNLYEELFLVRRRSGCSGAMVVWSQRGCLLPDNTVPRTDVLLPSEGSEPSGLLL